MDHQVAERDRPRDLKRRQALLHCVLPNRVVRGRRGERGSPLPVPAVLDDWGVDRVQVEPRVAQPAGERINRRLVVVVEVADRGEQLDLAETEFGQLLQVLGRQRPVVVEMRRDAEAHDRSALLFVERRDDLF